MPEINLAWVNNQPNNAMSPPPKAIINIFIKTIYHHYNPVKGVAHNDELIENYHLNMHLPSILAHCSAVQSQLYCTGLLSYHYFWLRYAQNSQLAAEHSETFSS